MNKKIILIGPPGTGKTSLKKSFFEKANPYELLENPLKPSRGVNSDVYKLFQSDLGVFDLAGQENDNWFSQRNKDVFNETNIIVCIFDIKNSLESIINFLIKIYDIKKELKLSSCKIITLIHKIDLVSDSYIKQKVKAVKSFITEQHPRGRYFEIFKTSITAQFLYNTFYILSSLLFSIFPNQLINLKKFDRIFLENEIKIISNLEESLSYNLGKIMNKNNFNKGELEIYLKNLMNLGFISVQSDNNSINLTQRGAFFREGLLKKHLKDPKLTIQKSSQIFYLFIFLYENN